MTIRQFILANGSPEIKSIIKKMRKSETITQAQELNEISAFEALQLTIAIDSLAKMQKAQEVRNYKVKA